MSIKLFAIWLIACAITVSGCSPSMLPVHIKNVAKNNLDIVAETSVKNTSDQLLQLTLELYRLNPKELDKVKNMTLQSRTTQIIEYPTTVAYKELNYKQDIEAIRLALTPSYRGDRVFALMIGISSMLDNAYNNQKEFYVIDRLNPQKLYDSSINLDLVYIIFLKQDADNSLLKTNDEENPYQVYALLNKISTIQEFTANLVSDHSGRIINRTLKGVATVFMPIGL